MYVLVLYHWWQFFHPPASLCQGHVKIWTWDSCVEVQCITNYTTEETWNQILLTTDYRVEIANVQSFHVKSLKSLENFFFFSFLIVQFWTGTRSTKGPRQGLSLWWSMRGPRCRVHVLHWRRKGLAAWSTTGGALAGTMATVDVVAKPTRGPRKVHCSPTKRGQFCFPAGAEGNTKLPCPLQRRIRKKRRIRRLVEKISGPGCICSHDLSFSLLSTRVFIFFAPSVIQAWV
jgi:hypothetical protein